MKLQEDKRMNEIKNIPLKKISPNPDQPRKYFDPEAMDALTASIERYGVLSPITVREAGDGKYELISGERRYRAAYKAGLKVIPCIIIDAPHSDCAMPLHPWCHSITACVTKAASTKALHSAYCIHVLSC